MAEDGSTAELPPQQQPAPLRCTCREEAERMECKSCFLRSRPFNVKSMLFSRGNREEAGETHRQQPRTGAGGGKLCCKAREQEERARPNRCTLCEFSSLDDTHEIAQSVFDGFDGKKEARETEQQRSCRGGRAGGSGGGDWANTCVLCKFNLVDAFRGAFKSVMDRFDGKREAGETDGQRLHRRGGGGGPGGGAGPGGGSGGGGSGGGGAGGGSKRDSLGKAEAYDGTLFFQPGTYDQWRRAKMVLLSCLLEAGGRGSLNARLLLNSEL